MKGLFEGYQLPTKEQARCGRIYWIEEIHAHILKTVPKVSYWGVLGRMVRGLPDTKTHTVRDFHFRLLHEENDPRSPYNSYAHAFYARTKVK